MECWEEHLIRLRELYPEREVITVAEASELLGMHRTTITNSSLAKKIGTRYVIPVINLARFLGGYER